MSVHRLADLTVSVEDSCQVNGLELTSLLDDLSFGRVSQGHDSVLPAAVTVRVHAAANPIPHDARKVHEWDGLSLYEAGPSAYICDGGSSMHVRVLEATADAHIAPAFSAQPRVRRQRFWAYGLMKLLRSRGAYGLHAAGVVTPDGSTVLIAGRSGSGKTTLALGLVRDGCGYLSDDSLLLRRRGPAVEAVGLRKAFSVSLGERKRRVDVQALYPDQHVVAAIPRLLVFPTIAPRPYTRIRPIPPADALGRLLRHCGPELYDRGTMGSQLDTLASLVGQARAYALDAGADLHADPALFLSYVADAEEAHRGACRS